MVDGSTERIIAETISARAWVDDGKGGTGVCLCISACCLSHLFQSTSALHSYVLLTQTAAAFQTKEDERRVIMTAEIQLITFFIF